MSTYYQIEYSIGQLCLLWLSTKLYLSLKHTHSLKNISVLYIECISIRSIHTTRSTDIVKHILLSTSLQVRHSIHPHRSFWHSGPPALSPLVVSLSRIMKEPVLFPEARSCLSASFLLTPLKNHLQKRGGHGRLHHEHCYCNHNDKNNCLKYCLT